jgi:hypothetical protein
MEWTGFWRNFDAIKKKEYVSSSSKINIVIYNNSK